MSLLISVALSCLWGDYKIFANYLLFIGSSTLEMQRT